jgi:hypothetical protein
MIRDAPLDGIFVIFVNHREVASIPTRASSVPSKSRGTERSSSDWRLVSFFPYEFALVSKGDTGNLGTLPQCHVFAANERF